MQIAPISSEALAAITPDLTNSFSAAANVNGGFSTMINQGLQQVNQQLLTTQADLQTLASGDVQNLHQIMMRMEDSRLSFQLMMQVRNRLLESYQDIMKMQV